MTSVRRTRGKQGGHREKGNRKTELWLSSYCDCCSQNPNSTISLLCASMASRCRSFSKPAFSFLKSTVNKPTVKPRPMSSLPTTRPSLTLSRPTPQLGSLQSLLPFHSAVSSARLTSCLGIDSRSSRSLSQGMLGANPGV